MIAGEIGERVKRLQRGGDTERVKFDYVLKWYLFFIYYGHNVCVALNDGV